MSILAINKYQIHAADAASEPDLKSSGPKGRAGSSPALGTIIPTYEQSHFCTLIRQPLLSLFCVYFYDLAAGVVTAVRADRMRPFRLLAVRTGLDLHERQRKVRAPAALLRLG